MRHIASASQRSWCHSAQRCPPPLESRLERPLWKWQGGNYVLFIFICLIYVLKDFETSKKYLKYPILSTSTSCWQMNFLCLSLTSSMTDITISCLKNVGGKLLIFNKKFLPTCLSPQLSYYQLFCLNWPHGISSLCELWNYLSHHHLYCSAEKGSQFHNIWHLSGKIAWEVTFIFYLNRFLFVKSEKKGIILLVSYFKVSILLWILDNVLK